MILSLALCPAGLLAAQTSSAKPQAPKPDLSAHPEWPKADPADVATIQSTVHAFYSAISAPAGGKLDRTRLRSLFTPGGRIVVGLAARGSRPADVIYLTPEEYAAGSNAATAQKGFFDRSPANQIEQFGVMAHVYSTYESRNREDEPKPIARGIKSFELLHSAGRWYIVQIYWDWESPENPLPEKYLHNNGK
ncbi:hypothetical protein [Granulicella rosea]|uniref:hypothetical protein n=1 Tax=Granulicella rosea TaxID=474952 RepID=UPI000B77356C|nr:hypothetical protein [Granulicella rosea]